MHTLLPHFVAGSKRVWRHPLRPALRRTGLFSGLFFCGFAKGYTGTFAALIDELAADVSIARKISLQSREGEIWAADQWYRKSKQARGVELTHKNSQAARASCESLSVAAPN
jgi:hypothetical protein